MVKTKQLKKLQGDKNSREGDFVRAYQALAKTQGHKHVSQSWYETGTSSYENVIEGLEKTKKENVDTELRYGDFSLAFGKKNYLKFGGIDHTISPLAMKQMERLAGIPSTLTNRLSGGDASDKLVLQNVFDNGFRHINEPVKFRFRNNQVICALPQKFHRLDNEWVLESLQKIIPNGRVSHYKGNPDTIKANILIPDSIRKDDDSDYGGMLAVGMSEVGECGLSTTPSLFRAICMNGCIWGEKKGVGFKLAYSSDYQLDDVYSRMRHNLVEQIPLIVGHVDDLLLTKDKQFVGSVEPVLYEVCKHEKLSPDLGLEVLAGYKFETEQVETSKGNLFGLINSVTRVSQLQGQMGWEQLDLIGGKMMYYSDKTWNKILDNAKEVEEEVVDKYFGITL